MRLTIISFPGSLLSRTPRLAIRLVFSLLISTAAVLSLLICRQTSRVVFGRSSSEVAGSLNLIVRDSLTGSAVSSEIDAKGKNGLATLSLDADGAGRYPLSSGRNDLEVHAVGYKNLATHFEPDSDSVKDVTIWIDPLEPPDELRPEVVSSKIRWGQALLHGHVFDSGTRQPISGAHVHLECAGVESQTNDRGYFLLYASVPSINPTQELPSLDTLVVRSEGFKAYRRAHVTIAEGATHFFTERIRGEGQCDSTDTHNIIPDPDHYKNPQPEKPTIT